MTLDCYAKCSGFDLRPEWKFNTQFRLSLYNIW
jgi:hypothetical protein